MDNILLSLNQSSLTLSLTVFLLSFPDKHQSKHNFQSIQTSNFRFFVDFSLLMTSILYDVKSPFSSHLSLLDPAFSGSKAQCSCNSARPMCLSLCILWQSLACETQAILNTATPGTSAWNWKKRCLRRGWERWRRNKRVVSRLVNRQVKVIMKHGSKGLYPPRLRNEWTLHAAIPTAHPLQACPSAMQVLPSPCSTGSVVYPSTA